LRVRSDGRTQALAVIEILGPLRDAAIETGLILGAHQRVGAAATVGFAGDIAVVAANRILDVATLRFSGLEGPGPAQRVGEEGREFPAVRAATIDPAVASEIGGRHQRFGDASLEMLEAGGAQAPGRRPVARRRTRLDQPAGGGDEQVVDREDCRPGEHVVDGFASASERAPRQ
jgi:hypothetical protein